MLDPFYLITGTFFSKLETFVQNRDVLHMDNKCLLYLDHTNEGQYHWYFLEKAILKNW